MNQSPARETGPSSAEEGLAADDRTGDHVPVHPHVAAAVQAPPHHPEPLADLGVLARTRRVVQSSLSSEEPRPIDEISSITTLSNLEERLCAPPTLRIIGGRGSGRSTVAAALRKRLGLQAKVEDIDTVAPPVGATHHATASTPPWEPPDIEILCLCTAPCRHEERWIARPRTHPFLVVATHQDARRIAPSWALNLAQLDARDPDHPSVDHLITWCEQAISRLPEVRAWRCTVELETLAADPESGQWAERALCQADEESEPQADADIQDLSPAGAA